MGNGSGSSCQVIGPAVCGGNRNMLSLRVVLMILMDVLMRRAEDNDGEAGLDKQNNDGDVWIGRIMMVKHVWIGRIMMVKYLWIGRIMMVKHVWIGRITMYAVKV